MICLFVPISKIVSHHELYTFYTICVCCTYYKPYASPKGKLHGPTMLEPVYCLHSEPLLPNDLVRTCFNVIQDVWIHVMRVAYTICSKQVWEFE